MSGRKGKLTIEEPADVSDLGRELVHGVVERLRALEPDAVAFVVRGSYARGRAQTSSDLDISAIVNERTASSEWWTWFEARAEAPPLHVSAGIHTVDEWRDFRKQPAWWALGLPSVTIAAYLWATDEARAALGDPPSNTHPPADASLEEFVEAIVKLRRARHGGDWVAVRLHAQVAARQSPGLLRELNPPQLVHDRVEAVEAALALPTAPEHYRDDLPLALGLRSGDDEAIAVSATRLAVELLAMLRERNPEVDRQPGLAAALADGTLERHIGSAD